MECDFYVLVIDALGPSLEDLLNYCGRTFTLKTVLLIADQAFRGRVVHFLKWILVSQSPCVLLLCPLSFTLQPFILGMSSL